MYDLLLRGGTVIDPAQNLNGRLDIGIEAGKIAQVAAGIDSKEATRTIDVTGKTVTPGLIDIHCQVADGLSIGAVHPDLAGVQAGVTTVVDAGTTARPSASSPNTLFPSLGQRSSPFCTSDRQALQPCPTS